MLGDGSGIRVRESTVPSYLLDGRHGSDRLSQIAHAVAVKRIKKNAAHQFKTVILRFPQGTTCNNKHFNKKGTRFLSNNVGFKELELKGKDPNVTLMESSVAFMTWKLAIDGTSRDFNNSDDEDSDDELAAALSKHNQKDQQASTPSMDVQEEDYEDYDQNQA